MKREEKKIESEVVGVIDTIVCWRWVDNTGMDIWTYERMNPKAAI